MTGRPSRVALDGSHATGKSTLLTALEREISDWHFISEGARAIAPAFELSSPADWVRLYEDKDRHRLFLEALLRRQLDEERQIPFISDGSVYRVYAYADAAGVGLDDAAASEVAYDLILYCPVGAIPFSEDGFRFVRDRNAVDEALRARIRQHHHGGLVELEGTPSERLERTIRILPDPVLNPSPTRVSRGIVES